jgi:arylsulfatase A-like enzyme
MTGMHTGHAWIRGNRRPEVRLRPQDITVAEVLKKPGYVTGMFGKWGLGPAETGGIPNKKGFDEWFGYLDQCTLTITGLMSYGTTRKSISFKAILAATGRSIRSSFSHNTHSIHQVAQGGTVLPLSALHDAAQRMGPAVICAVYE